MADNIISEHARKLAEDLDNRLRELVESCTSEPIELTNEWFEMQGLELIIHKQGFGYPSLYVLRKHGIEVGQFYF
jgi:hypothetical protein